MIMERWFSLFLHNFLVSPLEFADTEKTSTHMVCSNKELSKHHSCMNITAYSCLNIVCACPYSSNISMRPIGDNGCLKLLVLSNRP